MAYIAIGMAVVGAASAIIARREQNKNMLSEAKALGIKEGQILFSSERKADFLVREAARLGQERQSAIIDIDKAQARAISDAKVMAAAAGVDGKSVDAVVNDTERTSEEAKRSIDESVKAERLQLQANYTDNFLNSSMQIGTKEFRAPSNAEAALGVGLGFAKGYLQGL